MLALIGHRATSELSPLSGVKRKSDFGVVRQLLTRTSGRSVWGRQSTLHSPRRYAKAHFLKAKIEWDFRMADNPPTRARLR
jgi:hypothetical protein